MSAVPTAVLFCLSFLQLKGLDMRILHTLRRNPVAALLIVVAGIGGWLAAGLRKTPTPPQLTQQLTPRPPLPPIGEYLAGLNHPVTERHIASMSNLPKLKLGMTRVEVEDVIGPPAADSLRPITVTDGRATYQTAYDLAEPDLPSTVRPIKARPRILPRPATSQALVALVFDASKPGHPLLEIRYLDPLF
jgi:hypothetical protein